MPGQLLALDVQRPVFNVGAIQQEATGLMQGKANLQSSNLKNQSDTLALKNQTQESDALARYRAAAAAGDPNAEAQLKGNPEAEAAIRQYLDTIKTSQEADSIRTATKEWEQSLTAIDGQPPGSQAQKDAWSAEIDRLVKEKFLDPQSAAAAKANPPGSGLGYTQMRTHVDALIKGVSSHPATLDQATVKSLWQSAQDAVFGKGGIGKVTDLTVTNPDGSTTVIPRATVIKNMTETATQLYYKGLELVGGGMPPSDAIASATKTTPPSAPTADPRLKNNLFNPNGSVVSNVGNWLTNWATGGTNFPQAPAAPPAATAPAVDRPNAPLATNVSQLQGPLAPAPAPVPAAPTLPPPAAPVDVTNGAVQKGPAQATNDQGNTDYTPDNPATPTTQEEMDALPDGTPYVDPGDGQIYVKGE